ncbi:flagellar basal body rod protein [Aquabacterium fontiphilum]|uniref:flagellar basal body-associated FliL family protein n=1 Tax=Aquabacterium fontiphilum TaxID=450365 RepID=UPI001377319D|nr:flagellar basal body-associated FliL family protein [Aquabacterium fontiphilum]NBD21975.1 flagellar basal body rod protein [Aquabacterium fontiphilum]
MSAAPAAAQGEAPKKGSKKLIIIIAAVLSVLLIGGGVGAFMLMKGGHDEAAEGDDAELADEAPARKKAAPPAPKDKGAPPTFVPLDPFIVNLADRDVERFAQVGITLQIDNPKTAEEIKAYMPAIRNAVLLILSHKTAPELLTPEGKTKLADEISREAARAMGYEIEDPEEEEPEDAPKKKRKRKKVESYNPITHVHYANFIIQ